MQYMVPESLELKCIECKDEEKLQESSLLRLYKEQKNEIKLWIALNDFIL